MKPNDLIFRVAETTPLLNCEIVDATCRSVDIIDFRPFGQTKLVFHFIVFEPHRYVGTKLEMYARWNPNWKVPPRSSKIFKIASIATGGLRRNQRITKSMFVGKAFRCRVRTVGEGAAAYTVIDAIIELLAG